MLDAQVYVWELRGTVEVQPSACPAKERAGDCCQKLTADGRLLSYPLFVALSAPEDPHLRLPLRKLVQRLIDRRRTTAVTTVICQLASSQGLKAGA